MLPNSTEATPQQPSGGPEQPTSTPSGQVEPNPLLEEVKGLRSELQSQANLIKSLQSGNDKRFGQMDTSIKRILELGGQGLNETQIQRELFIDRMLQQGQNTQTPEQPTGSRPTQEQTFDVDGVIKSLKFADNDPALAALKIKYQGKPQELLQAAADLRVQQFQTSTPTPGTGLSQTSGNAGTGLTAEQIEEKTVQLGELYKNYSLNRPTIAALEKELEAAGVLKQR